jgi:hypothetical protein
MSSLFPQRKGIIGRRFPAIGLLYAGLISCAIPTPMPQPGDLRVDRLACNNAYPPRVGNYLPHAECVNAAIERDAIPFERYPDLVRLQERLRRKYSAQIDGGALSATAGERKMAEVDKTVTTAEHDRDTGRAGAADQRLDHLEAMLRQ